MIKINTLTVTLLLPFTDDIDHAAEFPRRRTMAEPTLPILPECPSGENSSVSRMDVSIHSGKDVDAETLQVKAEPTLLIPPALTIPIPPASTIPILYAQTFPILPALTLPILPECPSGENSSVSRMDVSIHSGRDVDADIHSGD